MNQTSISIK